MVGSNFSPRMVLENISAAPSTIHSIRLRPNSQPTTAAESANALELTAVTKEVWRECAGTNGRYESGLAQQREQLLGMEVKSQQKQ